jgi:hypothetical protein
VPQAGRDYFGLSRNGSYEAGRRGEIATIRIGNRLRVPVCRLERLLQEGSDSPDRSDARGLAAFAEPTVGSQDTGVSDGMEGQVICSHLQSQSRTPAERRRGTPISDSSHFA